MADNFGGWRDSRFGQFADPNFGKSLGGNSTVEGGGGPAAQQSRYATGWTSEGAFDTDWWTNNIREQDKYRPKYDFMTGSELEAPMHGSVWDIYNGGKQYWSRNDTGGIDWSTDVPDWDSQKAPSGGDGRGPGGYDPETQTAWFDAGGVVPTNQDPMAAFGLRGPSMPRGPMQPSVQGAGGSHGDLYQFRGSVGDQTRYFEDGGEVDDEGDEAPERVPYQENTFRQTKSDQGMIPEGDEPPEANPDEENLDPSKKARGAVSKIMDALSYGRSQAGLPTTFFGGTSGVHFAEGGSVGEDEGVINDGQQKPQMAMAYLTGEGALDPAQVQQLEAGFQGSPSARKYQAMESAPSPEAGFGLLQHYRKRFNAYSAFAQAAATGTPDGKPPNMASAAKAATQAFENIPDGNEVQFMPTQDGGIEIAYRPIIPSRPAPSGGEKPPPQEMAGNIPTIPAPSGGEKPPPFDAADDTVYAEEGGVIPGEEEDEIATGSVPPPPVEQPQQRPFIEFNPQWAPEDQMGWEGRAIKAGVEGAAEIGNTVKLSAQQFVNWLRGDGQMDSVIERGMDEATKAALQGPEVAGVQSPVPPEGAQGARFNEEQPQEPQASGQGRGGGGGAGWGGAPAGYRPPAEDPSHPGHAPQFMSTEGATKAFNFGAGQEQPGGRSAQLFKPEAAQVFAREQRQRAGNLTEELRQPSNPQDPMNEGWPGRLPPREQGGGRPQTFDQQVDEASRRIFPSVSQESQRQAWVWQQKQGRQAHADKLEIEKVKGQNQQGRIDAQQAGADRRAELSAAVRRDGFQATAERLAYKLQQDAERQGRWIDYKTASDEANRQLKELEGAANRAAAGQRSIANALPGELSDEQRRQMAGGQPQLRPRPQQATQPQQQAPAQQNQNPRAGGGRPQQQQQHPPAPRDPAQRKDGMTYVSPTGKLGVWNAASGQWQVM